eukprot:GHVU01150668.1.p1 GENE.GHVU01150668.1~~GHVU01150668.1.p1  ORF type:complete len:581 (-),score=71.18 GHVU01150668.1:3296-5038(-)
MKLQPATDGSFTSSTKGKHVSGGSVIRPAGANPIVKKIALAKLLSGKRPKVVAFEANDEVKKSNLTATPISAAQVRNLRKRMCENLRKQCPMRTVADLSEWAERNQVGGQGPYWDAMPVDHMFVPPGGVFDDPQFPAVAVTTKALLANALALSPSSLDVCMLLDGTFKLHDKNWVLLIAGVEALKFDRGANRHQFRPVCMCMAVSECVETYRVLLRSIAEGTRLLFNKAFSPKWALSDHCEPAQNAAAEVFPGILPLTCWPHLSRNAKKKGVLVIVGALHRCTTRKQFDALHKRVVEGMKEQRSDESNAATKAAGGELSGGAGATPAKPGTVGVSQLPSPTAAGAGGRGSGPPPLSAPSQAGGADKGLSAGKEEDAASPAALRERRFTKEQVKLVETTYGESRWRGWYRGASGVEGVTPNNNSLERFNRMLKDEYLHLGLRRCLSVLLGAKLPFVLKATSSDRGSSVAVTRQCGPVTSSMIRRAWRVKALPQFYELCGHELFLDATPHQMRPMTLERLVAYKAGVDGRIDHRVHWSDLPQHYLHVACVTFTGVREEPHVAGKGMPSVARSCNHNPLSYGF